MGFDAPVMMEAIGNFCREAYDDMVIDSLSSRLGITVEVVGTDPLKVRVSGEENDPVRSVVKGMIRQRVRSVNGKSAVMIDQGGVLSFDCKGSPFRNGGSDGDQILGFPLCMSSSDISN